MRARLPASPVDAESCLRALSRTTATVWVAAALLALVLASTTALGAAGTLGGPVGAVAGTTALLSLLLVACFLLSLAVRTVAATGFWLRSALRDAWDARTPPHSNGSERDPDSTTTESDTTATDSDSTARNPGPLGPLADEDERTASYGRAVTYLYWCLASSLVLFVAWLAVGTFRPGWFELVADSTVVEVLITVATFFVGVPLAAFPDVVVATGTGQPIGPDVVALVFAVVVVPSVPGVLATANAVHYLASVHYDAYQWAYAAATGERYRGVRECAWTDHAAVHAVTVACVAAAGSVLPSTPV